ncbi:reverse transcriptase domain-containing protein [uncultured Nostoc sp.]|uniref:reverse transcriptase domain-containing protein n=1 Tax=uncultured Nostoc sp. TaxID=340711 RepID=UPI00261A17F4|nr:reverse transcriptase domain-containing protein [uncultured Nostoc sp.]
MSKNLDDLLTEYFQPEKLKAAFKAYEQQKTDFFQQGEPKVQMGVDGISYQTFKKELDLRCQVLSNRLFKGTYQFYTFREIEIPKPSGGKRVLSIATIRDVIVQKVLYDAIYKEIEKDFQATHRLDKVSCAYRKGKSVPYAASLIHHYIKQGFIFALDADIVKFFDRLSHEYLFELIERKFGQDTLTNKLLIRFIKAGGLPHKNQRGKTYGYRFFHHHKPIFNNQRIIRTQGIPQGGVLSGMLANLYLHEFDCWVINDLSKKCSLRYVRYADDFVILLKQKELISIVHQEVAQKLQDIKLELHTDESKTKYVDIAKDFLEFVGFQFTLEHIKVKPGNILRFQQRIIEKINKEQSYKTGENFERRFSFFIKYVINRKVTGRGEKICDVCGGVLGERLKSWMGFFMVITDIQQIRELDKWIRKEVSKHFYKNYKLRLKKSDFKNVGLITLEQEYYRLRKRKACSCEKFNCSPSPINDSNAIHHTEVRQTLCWNFIWNFLERTFKKLFAL